MTERLLSVINGVLHYWLKKHKLLDVLSVEKMSGHYDFPLFRESPKIAPKENNVITMQRYFFVLEILDKQAFKWAPFNPVLFLSVLPIQ